MTVQSVANVLIAVLVIALLIARQVRWRAFDPARALRLPIVVGAVGLVNLAGLHGVRITALDGALFAVELAMSVGIGAAMGRLAVFRAGPDGGLQTRTGWGGAGLWAVLIAVRIGFDAVGEALGAHLLVQTGVILLLLAASRATAALVTRAREPHGLLTSA